MKSEWKSKLCHTCGETIYYLDKWKIKPSECNRCKILDIKNISQILREFINQIKTEKSAIIDQIYNGSPSEKEKSIKLAKKIYSEINKRKSKKTFIVNMICEDSKLTRTVIKLEKNYLVKSTRKKKITQKPTRKKINKNKSEKNQLNSGLTGNIYSGYVRVFQGGSPGLGKRH